MYAAQLNQAAHGTAMVAQFRACHECLAVPLRMLAFIWVHQDVSIYSGRQARLLLWASAAWQRGWFRGERCDCATCILKYVNMYLLLWFLHSGLKGGLLPIRDCRPKGELASCRELNWGAETKDHETTQLLNANDKNNQDHYPIWRRN